jgi:hypothetical protein
MKYRKKILSFCRIGGSVMLSVCRLEILLLNFLCHLSLFSTQEGQGGREVNITCSVYSLLSADWLAG